MDSVKQAHYLSSYEKDGDYFWSVASNKILDAHNANAIIINPEKKTTILNTLHFLSNIDNIGDMEYFDYGMTLTTYNYLIEKNGVKYHMELTQKYVLLLFPTNVNIPIDYLDY